MVSGVDDEEFLPSYCKHLSSLWFKVITNLIREISFVLPPFFLEWHYKHLQVCIAAVYPVDIIKYLSFANGILASIPREITSLFKNPTIISYFHLISSGAVCIGIKWTRVKLLHLEIIPTWRKVNIISDLALLHFK